MSQYDSDHAAVRRAHSPVVINNQELRAGRRWTLLQAIAWIATEVSSFVELVGSWTPLDEEYPEPGASRGAALELAKQLSHLNAPALSFAMAQLHFFRLLKSGSVVIFVCHTEHIPVGADFTALSYNSDYVGLVPAQDDRPWDYIVVDVESLRAAWAADPASQGSTNYTRYPENAAAPSNSDGKKFSRNSTWAEIAEWYRARVNAAPPGGYTRDEDEAAARDVGIGRERWRELRRELAPEDWGRSGPKKTGPSPD